MLRHCFCVSDRKSGGLSDCACSVPCERVRYDVSLSSAQLSRVNVETYVVTSDQKRTQLQVTWWLRNIQVHFKQEVKNLWHIWDINS